MFGHPTGSRAVTYSVFCCPQWLTVSDLRGLRRLQWIFNLHLDQTLVLNLCGLLGRKIHRHLRNVGYFVPLNGRNTPITLRTF